MNWNWFVNKQHSKRERFAGPLSIGSLAGAGLLLLVMLYPEKTLLTLLAAPEITSPAQQQYLEALIHLRKGDTNLVITLARSYVSAGDAGNAARVLELQRGIPTAGQKKAIMLVRYEISRLRLKAVVPGKTSWETARQGYAKQIEELRKAGATVSELGNYLADARQLGDRATVEHLESLLAKAVVQATAAPAPSTPEGRASAALAKKDYRSAADIYFTEMRTAPQNQKRKYYLLGVRTLQSGNLLQEALSAAETHLGNLNNDRQTLMFLTRLALAGNRPELAQQYISQALGLTTARPSGESAP